MEQVQAWKSEDGMVHASPEDAAAKNLQMALRTSVSAFDFSECQDIVLYREEIQEIFAALDAATGKREEETDGKED